MLFITLTWARSSLLSCCLHLGAPSTGATVALVCVAVDQPGQRRLPAHRRQRQLRLWQRRPPHVALLQREPNPCAAACTCCAACSSCCVHEPVRRWYAGHLQHVEASRRPRHSPLLNKLFVRCTDSHTQATGRALAEWWLEAGTFATLTLAAGTPLTVHRQDFQESACCWHAIAATLTRCYCSPGCAAGGWPAPYQPHRAQPATGRLWQLPGDSVCRPAQHLLPRVPAHHCAGDQRVQRRLQRYQHQCERLPKQHAVCVGVAL
jgi:hypothetical protein